MMPDNRILSAKNILLTMVIGIILLMAFISLAFAAYSGEVEFMAYVQHVFLWIVCVLFPLFVFVIPRILVQYGQVFYNLPPAETRNLLERLVLGSAQHAPSEAKRRIQDGKVTVEVPGVLEKVGGPGALKITHNNAVVTQKLGRLFRILGPGSHTLDAFEKVWDVVDLRLQHRTITVQFMTRDGIPACVEAEIAFRIPLIKEYERMQGRIGFPPTTLLAGDGTTLPQPTGVSADAVLAAATGKVVVKSHERLSVRDWMSSVTGEILDSTIREVLESYKLKDFLYPRKWHWLKSANQDGDYGYKLQRSSLMFDERTVIQHEVISLAGKRGIFVENVELGPILPVEDFISREWLESWQPKLQNVVYKNTRKDKIGPAEDSESLRAYLLAELVSRTVRTVQEREDNGYKVTPELVVESFVQSLHSLSGNEKVKKLLSAKEKELARIIEAVHSPDPPVDVTQTAP